MDLIKIGKYIAGKRKNLGMTQKQLANKLGMSDKSVSKWERGVCLPDVSVYSDLCMILGISINEFLAGEDIRQEDIGQKSEENIIGIAADSKRKLKHLRAIIGILLVMIVLVVARSFYRAHYVYVTVINNAEDDIYSLNMEYTFTGYFFDEMNGLPDGTSLPAGSGGSIGIFKPKVNSYEAFEKGEKFKVTLKNTFYKEWPETIRVRFKVNTDKQLNETNEKVVNEPNILDVAGGKKIRLNLMGSEDQGYILEIIK